MSFQGANILINGGLGYASSRAPGARRESQANQRSGHQRRSYGATFRPGTSAASPSPSRLR